MTETTLHLAPWQITQLRTLKFERRPDNLLRRGLVETTLDGYRVTPLGREALDAAVAQEWREPSPEEIDRLLDAPASDVLRALGADGRFDGCVGR